MLATDYLCIMGEGMAGREMGRPWMGHQGCAEIQGRKTDRRRDDYMKLFLILRSLHERKRQSLPTERGHSHLLAFLASQTPLFCRAGIGNAPFLPRLIILALMFIPRKVLAPAASAATLLAVRVCV